MAKNLEGVSLHCDRLLAAYHLRLERQSVNISVADKLGHGHIALECEPTADGLSQSKVSRIHTLGDEWRLQRAEGLAFYWYNSQRY